MCFSGILSNHPTFSLPSILIKRSSCENQFGTINKESKRTLLGELYNPWKDGGDKLCVGISWGNGLNLEPLKTGRHWLWDLRAKPGNQLTGPALSLFERSLNA